jgi:pyruvate formate lyase activating enzyme
MIHEMCRWIKSNLGADTPLYFSAFYPNYKLRGLPPTPVETLEKACQIAKDERLNYVYIGNIYGHIKESTFCVKCGKVLIKRTGYLVEENNLINGKCKYCGYPIPGVWK